MLNCYVAGGWPGSPAQRLWEFIRAIAQLNANRRSSAYAAVYGNPDFYIDPIADWHIHPNFYPNQNAHSGFSYPQPGFLV